MSDSNPRYPVPANVSAEAKAFLSLPIDLSFRERPSPTSVAEWEAQIAESNGMFEGVVRESVEKSPVVVSKTTMAGVTVREVVPEDEAALKKDQVLLNLHGGGYTMFGGDLSVLEAIGRIENTG